MNGEPIHIRLILDVNAFFADGAQLTTLGQEHDDEGDGTRNQQSESQAGPLIRLLQYHRGHDPRQPNGDGQGQQAADIFGLPVVVPVVSGLDGQGRREQDEEDHVEQGQDVVSGGEVAQSVGGGEPLQSDDQLHQEAEEEQQGLVRGRQVHARVQRDEEDQLDQQGRVNQGIGESGAEPDHGAG